MELDEDFLDKLAKTIGDTVSAQIKNKIATVLDMQKDIISQNESMLDEMRQCQKTLSDNALKREKRFYTMLEEEQTEHRTFVEHLNNQVENAGKKNSEIMKKAIMDVMEGYADKLGSVLEKYIDKHYEKIQEAYLSYSDVLEKKLAHNNEDIYAHYKDLSKQNINEYSSTLNKFKDIFVRANAEALANVEKDNVDAIAEAHRHVTSLAELSEQSLAVTMQQMREMKNLVADIKSVIAEDQQEMLEDFTEDFTSAIEKQIKKFTNDTAAKLETHQEEMERMNSNIEQVTLEYRNMFEQVIKHEEDIHAMTKQDLELLEKIIEEG